MQKLSLYTLPQHNTPLSSSLSPQSNPSSHNKFDTPFILKCRAAHRPQTPPTSSPLQLLPRVVFLEKREKSFFYNLFQSNSLDIQLQRMLLINKILQSHKNWTLQLDFILFRNNICTLSAPTFFTTVLIYFPTYLYLPHFQFCSNY